MKIRLGNKSDLTVIKDILDDNREVFGFMVAPCVERSLAAGEVLVCIDGDELLGFCRFHHRVDGQTTLYEICVDERRRRQGVGRQLIEALMEKALRMDHDRIFLRMPTDLVEAWPFYEAMGFSTDGIEPGKRRSLQRWVYGLDLLRFGE